MTGVLLYIFRYSAISSMFLHYGSFKNLPRYFAPKLNHMKKILYFLAVVMVLAACSKHTTIVSKPKPLPPGQMKKLTGSQSAKPYAPGQQKKAQSQNNSSEQKGNSEKKNNSSEQKANSQKNNSQQNSSKGKGKKN
jgi:hypothetical protein